MAKCASPPALSLAQLLPDDQPGDQALQFFRSLSNKDKACSGGRSGHNNFAFTNLLSTDKPAAITAILTKCNAALGNFQ
jgi:hypothetical protein